MGDPVSNPLGTRLIMEREKRGMTATAVEAASGVPQQRISDLESGRSPVSKKYGPVLARYYGMSEREYEALASLSLAMAGRSRVTRDSGVRKSYDTMLHKAIKAGAAALKSVPLYGDGYATGKIPCSIPHLAGVVNAYALRVTDRTMYPRFLMGWCVFVDTSADYLPGDDIVVEMGDGSRVIRSLLADMGDYIVVQSLIPKKAVKLKIGDFYGAHPIIATQKL